MDANKQIVLITGATGGIGRDTALYFARRGASLVLVDIDPDRGKALVEAIKQDNGDALFISCDISNEDAVVSMMQQASEHYGRIDVAFNNAGVELENSPTADCTTAIFDAVMSVNIRGVFLCMKYEIEQMLQQDRGGHIINTSSAAGLVAAPNRPAYTASKHAVIGLTKAAAVEYARHNIHINAICPGVVETDMYRKAMENNDELRADLEERLPMGCAGSTSDIAQAVAWLGSDQSRYIQGHALPLDGGFVAT